MPSVSASQIPALVSDLGLSVLMDGYDAVEQVAPRIFETVTISADAPPEGESGVVISGAKKPGRIGRGQDAPARSMDQVWQWFVKFHKYSERMDIPEEIYNSPDGQAAISRMIRDQFSGWGEGWAQVKEEQAANLFNKGVLSAGHIDTFDGSHPGRVATYPKYIYDGKPFFVATGNNHPLALSTATKFNLVVSSALSSTTLEATRVAMEDTNAVDEAGDKIAIRPDVLVVPPGLQQTAHVLLESMQKPGTANNDVNWIGDRPMAPVTWRWLTDSDGWFLGQRSKGVRIYHSGDMLRLVTSPPDAKNGNVTVRAVGYYGAVVTNWRYWYANNLATS